MRFPQFKARFYFPFLPFPKTPKLCSKQCSFPVTEIPLITGNGIPGTGIKMYMKKFFHLGHRDIHELGITKMIKNFFISINFHYRYRKSAKINEFFPLFSGNGN